MAKVFKSKLLLGVLCLLLAAVVAFVLLPKLYASKAETVTAVKLASDVPSGTMLTEEMLSTAQVGAYGLPGSVVRSAEDAVGKVAVEPMYAGEFLTETRLVTEEEYNTLELSRTKGLESGNCLVTIKLPGASSGVASVLRSGNLVDVQEWVKGEDKAVTVKKVLSSMYIYDVLNGKLQSLSALDKQKAEAAEEADFDFEPKYIVFRCTDAQAQVLIRLEHEESLHLTLQRAGG